MTVMSYETELKRDTDGTWYRWLGTNKNGTKQEFRLGKGKAESQTPPAIDPCNL